MAKVAFKGFRVFTSYQLTTTSVILKFRTTKYDYIQEIQIFDFNLLMIHSMIRIVKTSAIPEIKTRNTKIKLPYPKGLPVLSGHF